MPRSRPLTIVLTGGIASGKSTVADFFSELGVPIIDADQISRELVQSGSAILDKIISYFGKDYLDDKNHLNRAKLRERVFSSPNDREWLENLLHPKVYKIIQERIKAQTKNSTPYIICVIPLYFETQKPDDIRFDKIFVVDTAEKLQISRLMQRDHMVLGQVKNILEAQFPREARLESADEVIQNNGDIDLLKTEIVKIDKKYRAEYN